MNNKIKKLETVFSESLLDWTEEFENMDIVYICPKCEWEPDCSDNIISYSDKKYSPHLSMLSSLPQHTWCEIYECPKCDTIFKSEAESI